MDDLDMKKLIAPLLCIILAGCGYDDVEQRRDALVGSDPSTSNPSNPSSPSTPNPSTEGLWEYDQVGTSRFAEIRSSNTIPTSNELNDAIMIVRVQNFIDSAGTQEDFLTITVLFADTDCLVNCQLRHKKNGSTSDVYRVRQSINGVFSENSFAPGDMAKLIKNIKISNNASLSVPLIGVPDAEFEFDFSSYDNNFMTADR